MQHEKVGVIVARFQVPRLTTGHHEMLNAVKLRNDKLVVMLGVPVRHDAQNPLTYEMRRDMVLKERRDVYLVAPKDDRPGDNERWSAELDDLLRLLFPDCYITLYGGPDSFLKCYTGKLGTEELPLLGEARGIRGLGKQTERGTDLRQGCCQRPVNSEDFRAGVIYAVTNYPTIRTRHIAHEAWRDNVV